MIKITYRISTCRLEHFLFYVIFLHSIIFFPPPLGNEVKQNEIINETMLFKKGNSEP